MYSRYKLLFIYIFCKIFSQMRFIILKTVFQREVFYLNEVCSIVHIHLQVT